MGGSLAEGMGGFRLDVESRGRDEDKGLCDSMGLEAGRCSMRLGGIMACSGILGASLRCEARKETPLRL